MKKILSLLAVIFVTISASAQMYIWHNGQIIGEYDILGLDSVSFRKIVYHSVSADNVAEGEIIGLGNYPEGATLQITAEPARGYKFESWCDIESTENPRTITVTQDIKLCATFVKDTFNVALSVANEAMGSVTESTRVAFGKELVITATANIGYRFASWSDGYTENPRTIVVENDKNITALFITEIFNITTASSNDTYGYVVGTGTYPYGSTISLYACTNEGGKFMQWSDGSTENPRRITITADSLFTAEFAQKEVEQPQEPELTYELRVLTFEDKDAKFTEYELSYCSETIKIWSDLIATPEYMADMLYAMMLQSEDDRYAWYDEGNTFLASELPYNFYDYVYWGGGHAISNYASGDYVTYGSYENQLTVYGANQTYGETLTGGHNGSANFCMHFGYKDGSPYNGTENLPYIYFKDETPRIIDHMYINNSAYAINCYMSGNGLTAKIGPDDWVKAVAIGYDTDGNETGRTEIYLCNGPDNIVMEWTKWDLSVLGKVAKVDFNITGSSDNGYGFSQPAYFAYDDVAVRFEKSTIVEPEQPQEPELTYDLRTLTFEDKDAKFEDYTLVGGEANISTWSDLIDEPQYGGLLLYPNYATGAFEIDYAWFDENNTGLCHTSNPWGYATGGHAISNYASKEYGYTNADRDILIAKWYGEDYVKENAGNDAALGWFSVQLTTPTNGGHSGENFAVHFGYVDFFSMSDVMQGFEFEDGEARVIDHMYVTNTNYTLNQILYGVGSEAGNTFGGDYTGPTADTWYKIIAYGYANADDEEPTDSVDFYLFKDMQPVVDWTKWDLSVLGKVAKVRFNMFASEDMSGKYGLTIPAYFAYDDVAVRFDKK